MCKQLVWDVTVVDALAPSRLNQGSSCNPGTTATEAEAFKIEKYREFIDNGYIFIEFRTFRQKTFRQKTFRQRHGGGRFGKKNMPNVSG